MAGNAEYCLLHSFTPLLTNRWDAQLEQGLGAVVRGLLFASQCLQFCPVELYGVIVDWLQSQVLLHHGSSKLSPVRKFCANTGNERKTHNFRQSLWRMAAHHCPNITIVHWLHEDTLSLYLKGRGSGIQTSFCNCRVGRFFFSQIFFFTDYGLYESTLECVCAREYRWTRSQGRPASTYRTIRSNNYEIKWALYLLSL